VSDLHPEELLDAERSGTLSADELARLDAHCATCVACAAERVMVRDFAAARAERVPPERAERWVSGALAVLHEAPSRAAPRGIAIGIAVAALVVAAGAAAAYTAVSLGAFESSDPAPGDASEPIVPPEPVVAIAPDGGMPDAGAADAGARDAGEDERASTSPPASAAELFALGNREKRGRNTGAALRAFAEIERRYPSSNEAQVARVSAGTLLIGRDPRAALRLFDAYLSRGGPLALEAQAGRARALRALGRTAEERAQWERIVREHPSSIHAQRGRDRLEALR
jgi:hypothetical protein